MRAVLQRVTYARVEVEGAVAGEIGPGLLVLLGVARGDTRRDAEFVAAKVLQLRIFNDADDKMNLSVLDTGGSVQAVSQFTSYGDCSKGRRPRFDSAAAPAEACALYEHFVAALRQTGVQVETGIFQADMKVSLLNDGPVTVIVESPNRSEQ